MSLNNFQSSFYIDPFETQNRFAFLTPDERSYLHDTLEHLKGCRGRSCTIPRHTTTGGGGMGAIVSQPDHNFTQTQQRVNQRRKSEVTGKLPYFILILKK